MAVIPSATNQIRHVRKTITFTGGAGAGAVGTVTVFTITGRVLVEHFTGFVTTSLTEAGVGATVSVGPVSANAIYSGAAASVDLDANDWVYIGSPGWGYDMARNGDFSNILAISEDIVVDCAVDATNGGVIIFDLWYRPITDDGALAGDDIDTGYTPADVKAWLGTAAATPTVAGVPEVDLTHVAGATTNVAALATNVDAILTDTSTTLDDLIDTEIATIVTELAKVPKSDGTATWNATALAAIQSEANDALVAYDPPTHAEMTSELATADDAVLAAIAALNNPSAASITTAVWAQALSDLAAVPGVTATALAALNWLYELGRNKRIQTANTETVYKDDGATTLATSTKSDAGGTFTLGEYV